MKLLSKASEIGKMSLKQGFSYAGFTWASMAVSLLNIIVTYYVWMAVYGGRAVMHGISKEQMVTYVILSGVIYSGVQWQLNLYMSELIQNGEIAMEMLRPVDFQFSLFSSRIGGFISFLIVECMPVLVLAAILFGISMPATVTGALLFIVSLVMAVVIAFFLEFIIGLISFYTNSVWGLQHMKNAIATFCTGTLIPVAFFPDWLQTIILALPFKDMVYTPVAIYMGILSGEQALKAMLFQFIWLIALMTFSRVFFNIAIKKITVQGG
ncbi:MAG TPA: ABC-2 family transporter protein [Clostridia bacterium]|nr:ABC-2 family transporter protein [Clostridia bacterium]